jgi:hypothetical protein
MSEPKNPFIKRIRWRENILALLIAFAILGLIILSAGGPPPFIYGRF